MADALTAERFTRPDERGRTGIVLAAVAACLSGAAVFVNGYGVKRFSDATTYTTAKNIVAALVLVIVFASCSRSSRLRIGVPRSGGQWAALATIAVVGGSVPFVLFFEGLARTSSVDAAFLQKTLVVWVALLAVPLLGERVGPWHIAAIGLLVTGLVLMTHDLIVPRLSVGEVMVVAATLLWAVEVVIAKRLLGDLPPLTVATARMAGGVVVLLLWAGVRGQLGSLAGQGSAGWMWAGCRLPLVRCWIGMRCCVRRLRMRD